MRSTGPTGHRVGAQGRNEVGRPDATRVRGQFRPEVTLGAGHGQRQDGRADVVFGLTTLPFPPDGEDRSGQHRADPPCQFLTWHAQYLQLPIARCYLLLERALRLIHQGRRLHLDPLGQQGTENARQLRDLRLSRGRGPEAQVEVLAPRLASGRQRQAEAHQGVWHEALGVHDGQAAPAQGPFPDAGDVAVAREADLPRLGEAQAEAPLALRKHG